MKKILPLILLVVVCFSCVKKSKPPVAIDPCAGLYENGFIYGSDNPGIDGISHFFNDPVNDYFTIKPIKVAELPIEFRPKSYNDSIPVNVCLTLTTERVPCLCPTPYYYYKIKSIKKR